MKSELNKIIYQKNIEAKEKIEVGKTGVIIGDIKSPLLQMESGSKFTGNCAM